jgi:hypothetical protein
MVNEFVTVLVIFVRKCSLIRENFSVLADTTVAHRHIFTILPSRERNLNDL